MKKSNTISLIIILPLLIFSCWGDSSPTSDKAKTYNVSGSVTDKNGAGIEGVTVQITGTNFSLADTTDTMGIFAFDSIKSGDYKIKAQKDSCFFKPGRIEFTLNKTDVDTLKFISANNYIHGKVLDIMTDEGYEGIRIDLYKEKPFATGIEFIGSFRTEKDGEFEFFDLDKKDYHINFTNTNFKDREIADGFYLLDWEDFTDTEIIIPTYYFSSEKLRITKAEFSIDTKTLNIEWTPSKSKCVLGYWLSKRGTPFNKIGSYKIAKSMEYYTTNKASVEVTPKYVEGLFDQDIISGEVYFSVFVYYQKGKDYPEFYGPYSDEVSVRLYW